MPGDNELDKALKNLESGKFSFQMVDCIQQYIQKQEKELVELRAFEARALADFSRDELRIARLERDLKSANARIFALIRTNALLEQAIAATKAGIISFNEVVAPKVQQKAVEARPYVIDAAKFAWAALLKAYDAAAPRGRKLWLEIMEPRLKDFMKVASQSTATERDQR
jgi:hypothetical protein